MKRHWPISLFLFFCFSLLTAKAQPIDKTKELVVGVEVFDAYPHYLFKDGQYSGFAKDVFDLFAEKKGYKFVFKGFPVKRLYQSFVEGSIDFKYPDHDLWSSDLKAEYAKKKNYTIHYTPVTEYIEGVMVKKEKAGKGLKEFKDLGTILGFNSPAWDELMKKDKTITYKYNPDMDGLLNQLNSDRVHGALLEVAAAKRKIKELGWQDKVVFDKSLPYDRLEFKFSSWKHPAVIKEFEEFMKSENEAIQKLKEKYNLTEKDLFEK